MGKDKVRLTITLARFSGVTGKEEEEFEADVVDAYLSDGGSPYISMVSQSYRGGIAYLTSCLIDHRLKSITLYDVDSEEGHLDICGQSSNEQSEAFSLLEWICREDTVIPFGLTKGAEDKQLFKNGGPKRIEVTLRDDQLDKSKRIVLTELQEPIGSTVFFGVIGRVWRTSPNDATLIWLDKDISTTWSSGWDVIKIEEFLGGDLSRTTEQFSAVRQGEAWNRLATVFQQYTSTQIAIIKNWDADEDDTDVLAGWPNYGGQWYGEAANSQYWTSRVPNAYQKTKPKTAHYRVCGDEIGAHLHREQKRSWVGEGSPEPEHSLEAMLTGKPLEKTKEVAKTALEEPEIEDIVTRIVSSPYRPPRNHGACIECGGNLCTPMKCDNPKRRSLMQRVLNKGGVRVH
jgi:hypothetical protein